MENLKCPYCIRCDAPIEKIDYTAELDNFEARMSDKYEYIAARGNGKSGMAARDIAKAVRTMENKEYIEKEAALALSEHLDRENGNKHFVWGVETYAEYLQGLPAADVKPVVRGEWITKEYMYGDHSVGQEDMWVERLAEYGDQAYCSVCGEFALLDGGEECKLSNFCPHCGADMRKEANDER